MKHSLPQLLEVLAEKCLWLKGATSLNITPPPWAACVQWLVHKEVQTQPPRLDAWPSLKSHPNSQAPRAISKVSVCDHVTASLLPLLGLASSPLQVFSPRAPSQHNTYTPISIPKSYFSESPTLASKPLLCALPVEVGSIFQLTQVPIMCWAQS